MIGSLAISHLPAAGQRSRTGLLVKSGSGYNSTAVCVGVYLLKLQDSPAGCALPQSFIVPVQIINY